MREHLGQSRQLAVPAYKQVGWRQQATMRYPPRVSHPTAPPIFLYPCSQETITEHTTAYRAAAIARQGKGGG
jgi:hypothetical protein